MGSATSSLDVGFKASICVVAGARRNRHSDRLLLLENLPNLAHHIREQFKQNEKLAMQLSVLEGLMTDSQVEKAELEV